MATSKEYDLLTPVADFINAVPFNLDNFQQEVANDAAILVKPVLEDLLPQAGLPRRLRARWALGYPGDPTEAAYLARIPLHLGGTSNDAPERVFSSANVEATSPTPVTVLSITKTNVAAGTYQVSVNAMFRMVAEVASAEATLGLLINGQLRQFDQWRFTSNHSWGLSFPIDRLAGQALQIELQISRMGGASGVARALGLVPTSSLPACSIAIDRTG